MGIDLAQFHQVFFEESFEGIDVMESGLLALGDGAADTEQINAVFRAAHSIKGGSGTFGFSGIAAYTHAMETLLDEIRGGRRPATRAVVDVLLRSVDVLRQMLTAVRDGGAVDESQVQSQRAELARVLAGEPAQAPAPPVEGRTEPATAGWHVVFQPHAHLMRSGNDPLRLLRELATLGRLEVACDADALPALADLVPEDSYLSWDLHLEAAVPRSAIDEIFDWVEDDCDLAVMPLPATVGGGISEARVSAAPEPVDRAPEAPAPAQPPKAESAPPPAGSKSAPSGGGSIRVDTQKIDQLINMVGELVITQSMLGLLGADFDLGKLDRLREGLAQLERHTRELQEGVMRIRMLPIGFSFNRFPRLVHDLGASLGKRVELRISGESTEVDKTVIEKIGDPLVHLVRNSLDHGIESPAERLAAGKPEVGVIELKAAHRAGNVVIEIRDDGRGLDRDRILSKAAERGLVAPGAALGDAQVWELIFLPGFSTAELVSDVSGRGVGMDVVRRNINELGGCVEIESTRGRGSAITIRLPLTLAILDGQTVKVGGETYVVPLTSIVESIQVRRDMVNLVAGRGETFRLRGEYLPVIRLHETLGVPDPRVTALTDGLLVVVEGDGRRCGLLVDDLIGQQQVVIKSLESNYRRVDGIAGATIMGDGSVALILDVPGLIRLASRPAQPPAELRRIA
jgi:two-component system chemotaxis sensor kinase CheA